MIESVSSAHCTTQWHVHICDSLVCTSTFMLSLYVFLNYNVLVILGISSFSPHSNFHVLEKFFFLLVKSFYVFSLFL